MAAPATVHREAVAQAAAQLVAAGEKVTGWRLRRIIGSGNPARLEAVAREQADEAPTRPLPEPAAMVLPPTIADHLAEAEVRMLADLRGLIAQGWERASELAARRMAEEAEIARKRCVDFEAELAEASEVLVECDKRHDVLTNELNDAKAMAATAEKARQNADITALTAQAKLEEIRVALSTAERRAETAECLLKDAVAKFRPALVPAES